MRPRRQPRKESPRQMQPMRQVSRAGRAALAAAEAVAPAVSVGQAAATAVTGREAVEAAVPTAAEVGESAAGRRDKALAGARRVATVPEVRVREAMLAYPVLAKTAAATAAVVRAAEATRDSAAPMVTRRGGNPTHPSHHRSPSRLELRRRSNRWTRRKGAASAVQARRGCCRHRLAQRCQLGRCRRCRSHPAAKTPPRDLRRHPRRVRSTLRAGRGCAAAGTPLTPTAAGGQQQRRWCFLGPRR